MEPRSDTQHGARSLTHQVTWEDFLALDEDDPRELIDGDLVELEKPNERHEYIVALLVVMIGSWARAHKTGRVVASGYKVRVSARRGVMPDVQFFRKGNRPPNSEEGLQSGRPDLVVEVVSTSSRRYDRVTKLNWYAAIGVPEYWIVDPEDQSLERLVLHEGHYVTTNALLDDAVLRLETLPGLEIPLVELWAPIDGDDSASG
jgi:Uma2 family endonuclease